MDKRYVESPLDLQRHGKLLRAKDLGLTPNLNSSLEINQSFPRLSRKFKAAPKVQLSKGLLNPEMIDSISFSTQATLNSIHAEFHSNIIEDSINNSFQEEDVFPNPNPYKGVVTINLHTSQIIITNTIVSKMLGYSADELLLTKFCDLIHKEKSQLALPDMFFNEKGEIVVYNGKVIELLCKDGSKIAASCWLTPAESEENCDLYVVVIEPVQRVVSHLSLDEFGMILQADETAFSLFHCIEKEIIGHNIVKWIPNILLPSSGDSLSDEMRIQKTTGCTESHQSFPLTLRLDHYEEESDSVSLSEDSYILPYYKAIIWVFTNMSGMLLIDLNGLLIDCNPIFAQLALGYSRDQLVGRELGEILQNFIDPHYGRYRSMVKHKNGSMIPVSYFINGPVEGLDIFQVWMAISTPVSENLTCYTLDSTRNRSLAPNHSIAKDILKSSEPVSKDSSVYEDDMYAGEYSTNYQFVKQIGSGGFGSVQLSVDTRSNQLVITKFIKKSKVYTDSWVETSNGQRLPYEIFFLQQIHHDHIVNMIQFFENDTYFQLVMEKHGFGMDLFEFIEKTNGVPEPLGAYIFKQIADAVDYLHVNGILHRDIKDENVVLDDHFHTKLIDFGSAAYLTGKPYAAFCGTFEYCSPEVLKGTPYRGPELEVWAMGVTLYVLVFGRNPFTGVEEILKNELEFPDDASLELRELLGGMMDRNYQERLCIENILNNDWLNQIVPIEQYDFYSVCDLSQSNIQFQNSRCAQVADSLVTSTPYKKISPASKKSHNNSSLLDVQDESIHFKVPELAFNELSILSNNSD